MTDKFEQIMVDNEDLEVLVNTQELREVLVDYVRTKRELKVITEKHKVLSDVIKMIERPKHTFVDIKGTLANYVC